MKAGFIPILSIKQWNKSDKKRKIVRIKLSFIHTQRFKTLHV